MRFIPGTTLQQINELYARWQKHEFPNERFGQVVCNHLLIGTQSWSELYYEVNSGTAYRMAYEEVSR